MGRKWKLACVFGVVTCLILYTEVLSGILKRRHWAEFKDRGRPVTTPNLDKDESLRILLVADPQLIGEENEPPFLGIFTRWDSDNYLHRNYKLAREHVKPHLVAFLGDIFDEGNQAHDIAYRRYARRFADIFELPRKSDPSDTEYIYLPGDNDVGGENEAINPIKLRWFNLTFGDFEEPFWLRKNDFNVQFLKLWQMAFSTHEGYQKYIQKITNLSSKDSFDGFRVILSHMPYWRYSSKEFRKMVAELKPTLILSANDHKSSLIVFNEDSDQYKHSTNFMLIPNATGQPNPPFYRMSLRKASDKMVLREITVPTCSYRMGVPDMGFGALQLYKNGTMDYTVLWLPSRFQQLKVYLGVYILWKLIFTPWILWKIYCYLMEKYRGWRKQDKDTKHLV